MTVRLQVARNSMLEQMLLEIEKPYQSVGRPDSCISAVEYVLSNTVVLAVKELVGLV